MIITVVGLGVIGGSYVQAMHGLGYDVYGVDCNEETLALAKKQGILKKDMSMDMILLPKVI